MGRHQTEAAYLKFGFDATLENGPDYIFLEPPDDQERLASYLKEREAEGVENPGTSCLRWLS
jgi:hypothetical protein